ncbi:MAG: FlgD immunoglobulin-like domain containing protein [FCB group bacterium]|jgi:hypothetical protein
MKTNKIKFVILSLLISFSFLLPGYSFAQSENTEVDLLRNRESEENFKLQRQQWIEQMHRTEPNINWRIIDNATRQSKHEIRQKNIEEMLRSGNYLIQSDENVAGGFLTGSWIEKGSNNLAGRIHTADIDFDNEIIYAASSGGNIWKGGLDGTNWQCLNNGIQFSNIRKVKYFSFNGTNRIFVLENSKAYYSDNDGLIWNIAKGTDEVTKTGSFQQAAIANGDSTGIYLIGGTWDYNNYQYNTEVYLSKDYGENFQKFFSTSVIPELCDIWAPQSKSNNIYMLNKDTLLSIDLSGKVSNIGFLQIQQSIDNFDRFYLRGSFTAGKSKFYTFLHNQTSNIYIINSSTDGGYTWNSAGSLDFGVFEQNSISVSADNPNTLFYGGVEAFRSTDGGASWNKINNWFDYYGNIKTLLHADIPGIVPLANPFGDEIILVGTDGGLYISYDHLKTVQNLSLSGLNVSQYYSVYTNRQDYNKIYAGSQDQGLQRCLTDTAGKAVSFEQVISGDYGHLASADSGKSVWSVYPGFAQLYTDFDKQNTNRVAWDFRDKTGLWLPPLIEDPKDPQSAYIASGGDGKGSQNVWHLDGSSGSINSLMMPYNFNPSNNGDLVSAMRFSSLNNNYFYTLTSQGHFFSSTNAGNDWTMCQNFTGPQAHYFYGSSIEASAKTLGTLYIAGSGYSNPGVYMSTDNGVSFTPLDSGFPKTMIYKIAVSPDDKYIFAATEVGPYVYVASRNRWFDMSGTNTPDQTYWSVEYLDAIKTARFVTYGRGIWDFKISSFNDKPLLVNDENNTATAIKITAYPNPVGTQTNIAVEMPQTAAGTLRIYDLSGKIVAELFTGKFAKGTNSFTWDGRTDNGTNLSTGYYMCVVSSMGRANYVKLEKK